MLRQPCVVIDKKKATAALRRPENEKDKGSYLRPFTVEDAIGAMRCAVRCVRNTVQMNPEQEIKFKLGSYTFRDTQRDFLWNIHSGDLRSYS